MERLFNPYPLVREASYGATITLEKEKNFFVLSSVDHTCEYTQKEKFEDEEEALMNFGFWCIDITPEMELREDGKIGYYPILHNKKNYEEPTLF